MFGTSFDIIWTPLAILGLVIGVGAGVAWWKMALSRRLANSILRGAAVASVLYLIFLLVTAGFMVANRFWVQIPAGVGPINIYYPDDYMPYTGIGSDRPESIIITHLEGERMLPDESASVIRGATFDRLAFHSRNGSVIKMHPVKWYRLGMVLIRRDPDENWWDDDPTFLATVELSVEFEDVGKRDTVIELVSDNIVPRDFLGLRSQGYLTPLLGDWRPERLIIK